MAGTPEFETVVGCDETESAGGAGEMDGGSAGGAGRNGCDSAGRFSGAVRGGLSAGTFAGTPGSAKGVGAMDGGGEVMGPDGVGHEGVGGQESSSNIFFQLLRQDFSGFAVVTSIDVEAWLYHAARSPAISWIKACGLLCPGAGRHAGSGQNRAFFRLNFFPPASYSSPDHVAVVAKTGS